MSDLLKKKTGIKVTAEELNPHVPSERSDEETAVLNLVHIKNEEEYLAFEPSAVRKENPPVKKDTYCFLKSIPALTVTVIIAVLFSLTALGWHVTLFYDELIYSSWKILGPLNEAADNIDSSDGDIILLEQHGPVEVANIRRAVEYYVSADGVVPSCMGEYDGIKVSEVLEKAGIKVEGDDIVSKDMNDTLSAGETVTVSRVTYEEYTETQVIEYKARIKQSPLLDEGEEINIYPYDPEDGLKEITYRDKYIDGVLSEHTVVNENIIEEAVDYITLVGADVPASEINGALYTDVQIVDNVPTSYTKLISGNCTAYSYNPPVYGAGGMYLMQGFVAVDPSVIPYGSLLYITSPDGSFVYGWAIAADACRAAMEGRLLVDLFYETYRESCLWGKHYMNVYVICQLTQSQLIEYRACDLFERIPK